MPLCLSKALRENTQLTAWQIDESMDQLGSLLPHGLKDSGPRPHHRHWLASRIALGTIFPSLSITLSKDENNKPSLIVDEEAWFISISHSFDKAAVIVSPLLPVALDLERLDSRIERVQHKFIGDVESQFVVDAYRREMLTVIWSAKETMYKLYGKKEVDFQKELKIEPFGWDPAGFSLSATLEKQGNKLNATVEVLVQDDYVVTWIA